MVKYYFKIVNNILVSNLIYILFIFGIILNIVFRIWPHFFLDERLYKGMIAQDVIPKELFIWCDVYILTVFILLIVFLIGMDYKNSTSDITLVCGGCKSNKFQLRKLFILISIFIFIYAISYLNIYNIIKEFCDEEVLIISFNQCLIYSIPAIIFILSLTLFILVISKDIYITLVIIISYYFIEEYLWKCKVTQEYGLLGQVWSNILLPNEIILVRGSYLFAACIFLLLSYNFSKRKTFSILFKHTHKKKDASLADKKSASETPFLLLLCKTQYVFQYVNDAYFKIDIL